MAVEKTDAIKTCPGLYAKTCKVFLDQGRGTYVACYHGPHELRIIADGPQKLISFILKFYLYHLKENKERKLCQTARDFS